jgi:hypothetical protein
VTADNSDDGPARRETRNSTAALLCWIQGCYFLLTGVWPLLSLETFEAVTGEKTDDWLVITVGVLVAAIGIVLLMSAWRRNVSPEIALLGCATAASLAVVDVVYVAKRVIAPIYLLDAAIEALLVCAWAMWWAMSASKRPRRRKEES